MADEAAEAAFISAMQNNNDAMGMMQGVSGAASHEQAASEDEYEPALAEQADSIMTDAQDPSVLSPSTTVKHVALSTSSTFQNATSLAAATQELPDYNAQNESRSMSPDSSESVKAEFITEQGPEDETLPGLSVDEALATNDEAGNATVANGDSLAQASHTAPSILPDSISTPNVPLQSDVPNRQSPEVVQNGVAHSDSAVPASLPDPQDVAQGNSRAQIWIPQPVSQAEEPAETQETTAPTTCVPKARLPHDRIGILEDRIKEDPRGDTDAWLSLIGEHRKRGKLEEARKDYERLLAIFPWAAEQWVAYAQMENEASEISRMEQIFGAALHSVPSVQFWTMYTEHVRRRQNVTTDRTGTARQTVHQAFRVALDHVGMDKDAGRLWQDYVQFVKSWPGTLGDSSWQAQQKMDELRKIYREAIAIPTPSVSALWKEYEQFETSLNKMTGRKFLQERSPSYMTARSSNTMLQNITRNLKRTTLPILPPALGFDGHDEYMSQLEIWKAWITWEKEDCLVLKDEDRKSYRDRIIHVYKQALMALRFWPEMWFDAAEFSYSEDLEEEGNDFLAQGIAANPECCLLAFKQADRIELKGPNGDGDEALIRRGAAVREPYNKLLDALYSLMDKTMKREEHEMVRIEAEYTLQKEQQSIIRMQEDDDENNDNDEELAELGKRKASNIEAAKKSNTAHVELLKKIVTQAWIALMRCMRRVQGKGRPNDPVGGFRQVFADGRKRGRITSELYSESALIEYHCYEKDTGRKVFDRGLKLFPEDEVLALVYIKHLIDTSDHTNARVVFETAVSRLGQKPETLAKAKPLYAFFLDFESRYGELTQIVKLEARMKDLFPEDPTLSSFSQRFKASAFDATAIRLVVSPTQIKQKARVLPSVEGPSQQQQDTPPKPNAPFGNSPKRPLPLDDSDTEGGRPRKAIRGESPLKGAAGRRLDQQKRNRQNDTPQYDGPSHIPPPQPPLGNLITFLLSILPKASTYHISFLPPSGIIKLLRDTHIPSHESQLPPRPANRAPPQYSQPPQHQPSQPPPPPPHLSRMQNMQHGQYIPPPQHMPSMQPIPPQQYGQFNSGYQTFPFHLHQRLPTFPQDMSPQRPEVYMGVSGGLHRAIPDSRMRGISLPEPPRRPSISEMPLAAFPRRKDPNDGGSP